MDSPVPMQAPRPSGGVATADHAMRWRVAALERQLQESKAADIATSAALKSAGEAINLLTAKIAQRESELSTLQTELVEQQNQWRTRSKRAQEKAAQLEFLQNAVVDFTAELQSRYPGRPNYPSDLPSYMMIYMHFSGLKRLNPGMQRCYKQMHCRNGTETS